MTSFPVGLGSRPPCLGQECSPIRSTPCGAGRETGSSAATARTTSGGASQRVLPPGRVELRRAAAFGRRRRRRRSAPLRHLPEPLPDIPSPAVVQQSYRKVDTWLQHHPTPEVDSYDVTPVSDHRPSPENQLKRKLIRGEADSAAKRRVTDSDSCSLPSGTFTSDDEEDEVDDNDNTRIDRTAIKDQSVQRRAVPASPVSPPFQSTAPTRMVMSSPRRKKRSPLVDAVCSRRRPARRYGEGETGLSDVSSGVLGDCSSSLATSGDRAPCRRQPSTVCRAAKTTATSRKNVVERRREVLRRVTRMTRRLHRVAAADAQSNIHVQTLAVL